MLDSPIGGCIPIEKFQLDIKNRMVIHTVPITSDESFEKKACRYCDFNEYCSMLRNRDTIYNTTFTKIGFKFSNEEFEKVLKISENNY